jgi:hypothetical protein
VFATERRRCEIDSAWSEAKAAENALVVSGMLRRTEPQPALFAALPVRQKIDHIGDSFEFGRELPRFVRRKHRVRAERRCHVTYRHDATCQPGGCCACAFTRLNYSIDSSRSSACSIKCSASSSWISRPRKDAFSRVVIIFRAISFRRLVRSTILSSSTA